MILIIPAAVIEIALVRRQLRGMPLVEQEPFRGRGALMHIKELPLYVV